jgi:hypothetical protein
MVMIFNLVKEYRPLLFFMFFAFLLFIIALCLGIPVLIGFFNTGLVEKFPSLIVAGMLVTLSFLSFATGLILDIIKKKSQQQFEIDLNLVSKNEK